MSHVHPIFGQLNAAERYQAYFERTQAAYLADREERLRRKSRKEAFDSAVDPDRNGGRKFRHDHSRDRSKETEDETDQPTGFGKRYA